MKSQPMPIHELPMVHAKVLTKGLKIAFASGSVMGMTVVGLGLFGYKRMV